MESPSAYIPIDRRLAIAMGETLPDRMEGTALFADISGFTPLTDAFLHALGPKRGADELTQQLNLVYAALTREVHNYRGSIINFSGDAITCWFDQDTGLRATACGLAMQQAMSHFSAVATPDGGLVSLSLKVAAASGPVRRFLVGDPQIQYIDVLAGATLDRMAMAETYAKQGELLLSQEIVTQLGDKVKVTEWRHGKLKTRARSTGPLVSFGVVAGLDVALEATPWLPDFDPPSGEAVVELSEAQIRPWLLPPVYQRLYSGQGEFLAEIRPAVVLFLKFDGLDYDHDETAGEKLDTYIRWVQNVLVRHNSYVMQLLIGDKGSYLYAIFGAPLAHDDDSERALSAAMELQTSPQKFDFITQVQLGLDQGRMRAGAYGSPARRTYGVLGDGVNIAARLMSQAAPGQIMVSQRIVEACQQSYYFKYL
ncbi:MAG TPA: adenylate/guanylate cyclase domain-containing protein, partial [Anaerolineae bacterium]|nr:adenylate/guanylate cyclase domain-containing protein [Anaerolineae bacterium]